VIFERNGKIYEGIHKWVLRNFLVMEDYIFWMVVTCDIDVILIDVIDLFLF